MRSCLLFEFVLFLIPAAAFAQDSTATISLDRKWADIKFKSEIELGNMALRPNITSIPPIRSDSSSAFSRQIQNFNQQQQIVINQPSQFHSNMPIVKPRKTSKILIAKLDPEFPYQYNMPVKKVDGNDE